MYIVYDMRVRVQLSPYKKARVSYMDI